MKIEQRLITPEVAKSLLKSNTCNFRSLNNSRVIKYARDMAASAWLDCGDPLRISATGVLLDGQHRLHAIIKSGVSVSMVVIADLDERSAMMMDKGQSRTVSSWMQHKKIKNASNIASLSRAVLVHRLGLWSQPAWASDKYTDSDVIAIGERHEETLQSALRTARIAENKTYIATSILATLMHEAAFPKKAEDTFLCVWFCTSLRDGLDLSKEDAVYHLRERFFVGAEGKLSSRRENPFIMRALSLIAWNKTAKQERVKILRFTPVGPGRTELPKYIVNINNDGGQWSE